MENGWTSSLDTIRESAAQCDDTWKQSESERFMAKKRPRKRANLEQRRDLWPPVGSRTLSRIWCNWYKPHYVRGRGQWDTR